MFAQEYLTGGSKSLLWLCWSSKPSMAAQQHCVKWLSVLGASGLQRLGYLFTVLCVERRKCGYSPEMRAGACRSHCLWQACRFLAWNLFGLQHRTPHFCCMLWPLPCVCSSQWISESLTASRVKRWFILCSLGRERGTFPQCPPQNSTLLKCKQTFVQTSVAVASPCGGVIGRCV